jgi:hypothetical protein
MDYSRELNNVLKDCKNLLGPNETTAGRIRPAGRHLFVTGIDNSIVDL